MKEPLLPVAEALARVLISAREPLEAEEVALANARWPDAGEGRRRVAHPAAVRQFGDGRLCAFERRRGASPGARLRMIGESAAGRAFAGVVRRGECVRIFTGAPHPGRRRRGRAAGRRAARRRLDRTFRCGPRRASMCGVSASTSPTAKFSCAPETGSPPAAVALAAAANHATLPCRRLPRVAILATGDELVAPGQKIGPAQIVASNNFFIHGLVAASGGEPIDLGIAADRPEALAASIRSALALRADVLVTLGRRLGRRLRPGAKGARRRRHGAKLLAHCDAAGKAADAWPYRRDAGARPARQSRPRPPSAACCSCARFFARYSAIPMRGPISASPRGSRSRCPPNSFRQDYMRAGLSRAEDGGWLAAPAPDQDSSLVKTLARADALIVRPPNAPAAAAGEPCRILRLASFGA